MNRRPGVLIFPHGEVRIPTEIDSELAKVPTHKHDPMALDRRRTSARRAHAWFDRQAQRLAEAYDAGRPTEFALEPFKAKQ